MVTIITGMCCSACPQNVGVSNIAGKVNVYVGGKSMRLCFCFYIYCRSEVHTLYEYCCSLLSLFNYIYFIYAYNLFFSPYIAGMG